MCFTDLLSDESISATIKLLKDLEADLDANDDNDASKRLSAESAAEIVHGAWITLDVILAKRRQGDTGYDYDRAPTDPRHGGKLTAEQASARIAELEAENAELRGRRHQQEMTSLVADLRSVTQNEDDVSTWVRNSCAAAADRIEALEAENTKLRALLAKSNADCPYCGLPAAEMTRCAHGFPGCGRADDMLAESD